jgi:acetolactate decarboxylase
MKRVTFLSATLVALLLSGCLTSSPNGITQVATIDALLAGVYDGHLSLMDLRRHGDFGIGTFERLDGEMILLDGLFYQVRANGRVYRPPLLERTPFACVTPFVPDYRASITTPADMQALERLIDAAVPEQNRFCAFRVHGYFKHVRTRSVPAQTKPYRPLSEVTRNQPVFEIDEVRGTVIGFRSPPFVKGVNVPGYHMHFLADDLSSGGHVLAFQLTRGTLAMDTLHDWMHVYLPEGSNAFATTDLSQDRSRELQAVEK